MALFDFLKKREIETINTLRQELAEAQKEIQDLSKYQAIADTNKELHKLELEIDHKKRLFKDEESQIISKIESKKKDLQLLDHQIKIKKAEIVELNDTILLQEFGLYSPIYDFANSELYKRSLDEVRLRQKEMILNETAAVCDQVWTVNGSVAQGRIMTNQNIKQIIRCFNDECDVLISKVKFNNIKAYEDKIDKSFNVLNKMNSKNAVRLSLDYKRAKLDELHIAYEYAVKKQEEKEEAKRIREQMREEAKLQKEIEEARRDIEKEKSHYENALKKLMAQMSDCSDDERIPLEEKKSEIENHLSQIDDAIKDIDYREANKRAGYVYIISNIGSFGEDVYKIGMTRRLDPMERVEELGDASVPFKFDVHALIFSDDAPSLETALHRAFESRKVNMVNGRREFFAVTLDEIEDVVKSNYDKTVEFVRVPSAEQYRESIKLRQTALNRDANTYINTKL